MLPAKLHLRCAVYLHEVNLFKKLGCVTGPGCTKRNSHSKQRKVSRYMPYYAANLLVISYGCNGSSSDIAALTADATISRNIHNMQVAKEEPRYWTAPPLQSVSCHRCLGTLCAPPE